MAIRGDLGEQVGQQRVFFWGEIGAVVCGAAAVVAVIEGAGNYRRVCWWRAGHACNSKEGIMPRVVGDGGIEKGESRRDPKFGSGRSDRLTSYDDQAMV